MRFITRVLGVGALGLAIGLATAGAASTIRAARSRPIERNEKRFHMLLCLLRLF